MRKAGERVRITAQLLDAASDGHVWAERFDRTLDDIFAIQDEISMAVAAALKLRLAPEERRLIGSRPTTNGEAYELFVMARQFERSGSERMMPLVVRICQRIVELDPEFSPAWALMASAEADMAQSMVAGASPQRARAAAERALAIDPDSAQSNVAMAQAIGLGDSFDVGAGQPFVAKALALDPDNFDAHAVAGIYSIKQRDFADAIFHCERACELDPDAVRPAAMAVQAYQGAGDAAGVLAASRRSLARCERMLAKEPDHAGALGIFVTSLFELGEIERAQLWAGRIALFDPDSMRLRYNVACGMAQVGDATRACALLAPVIEEVSTGWLTWIENDSDFDKIRDAPCFQALLERMRARLAETAAPGEAPTVSED